MFSSLTSYIWGSNTPQPSEETKNDLYDPLTSNSGNDFVDDLSAMEIGSSDEDEPEAAKGKRTAKGNDEWIFIDDEKLGLRRVKKNDTWFKVTKRNFVKPLPRNHVMKKYGRRFNRLYQNTDRRAYARYCTELNKLDPKITFADKVKAWHIEDKNSGEQIPEVKKPERPKKLRGHPVSLSDDYSEDSEGRTPESVRCSQDVEYNWRSVSRVKGTKRDTQTNNNFNSKKKINIAVPKPKLTVTDDDIEKYLSKRGRNEPKKKIPEENTVKKTVKVAVVPTKENLPSPKAEKEKQPVIQKTPVAVCTKITTPKPTKIVTPVRMTEHKTVTPVRMTENKSVTPVRMTENKSVTPVQKTRKELVTELSTYHRLLIARMEKHRNPDNYTSWSQFCHDNFWSLPFSPRPHRLDNAEKKEEAKLPTNRNYETEHIADKPFSIYEFKNSLVEQRKRNSGNEFDGGDLKNPNAKKIIHLQKYTNHQEEPQMRKKKTTTEPVTLPNMFKNPNKEQKEKDTKEKEDKLITRRMDETYRCYKNDERRKMTRKSLMSANKARAAASAGNGRLRRADRMNHTVCARSNNNRKIH